MEREEGSSSISDLLLPGKVSSNLRTTNARSEDHPFDFPDSYIECLAFIKVGFNAPYRMVEGATESLSEYISVIQKRHMFHPDQEKDGSTHEGKQTS